MWVHIHILNTVNQNNTKWQKPPECSSMDQWMDHMCLHTKECHLAFTSKEMLVLAVAYTNLKGMLSEIALSQEDKHGKSPRTGGIQRVQFKGTKWTEYIASHQ